MNFHAHSDPAARRIIFWRHGRTAWNSNGLFQGQEDIGLDSVGREQAARAAEILALRRPVRILSSDLTRASDTAKFLGELTGLPVGLDVRLRETAAGAWQGLSFAQIDEKFPEANAAWRGGDPLVRAGGAENREEVGRRMRIATTQAVESLNEGETLVIVSHGGAIRSGLASLMGLPSLVWGALSGVSNCHWSALDEQVRVDDALYTWQLREHNVGIGSLPSEPVEG
ncbi:histidine phosphatase family protein [Arthrobacter sp. H41]|uniref:histidine phosphatase family protein n=1 Tax=Arthrobacter sp. H41 TaxID=1312978 RepID=UPI0004BB9629|nr:histidine phosphatase family protein [Arthrobacter sp. H41]